MIFTTAALARVHRNPFNTLGGFLAFILGILLLGLGGFAKDKKYKDSTPEPHTLSDYVLGAIGLVLIIGGMIYDMNAKY